MTEETLDLTPPTVGKPKKEKVAKEPKAPKEPKVAKEPKRTKFAALYPEDAIITVLTDKNPKKEGSAAHGRFACYASGQTVGDFFVASANLPVPGSYADISYDVGHGYISVTKR